MTLDLRFSLWLFFLALILHIAAAAAVVASGLTTPVAIILETFVTISFCHAIWRLSPTGKGRWRYCHLGENSSLLVSASQSDELGPAYVSYFSEWLLVLGFEPMEKSPWWWLKPKPCLVLAPDSLHSMQQSQVRRHFLFRE